MTPNVNILHFFSDGPTSQYRQKGNFHLLNILPKEMEFEYCTWSFSESGHGKSIADGIGGAVKRTLDRHVSYGVDAKDATQIYYILREHFKTTKMYLVDDSQIENYISKIQNLKTLSGTLNLHQVITSEKNEIKYRELSCFCGDVKGMCLCHSPQSHLLKMTDQSFSVDETVGNDQFVSNHFQIDQNCIVDEISVEESIVIPVEMAKSGSPSPPTEYIDLTSGTDNSSFLCLESLKPLKKKSDENKYNAETKTSINVKRVLCCTACHTTGQLAKCIICMLWYCSSCAGGQLQIDFICDPCLSFNF